MPDSKTIRIVKSMAPVLKQHSKAIGKRFYELLFSKAPELYNMFNQTNQKRGGNRVFYKHKKREVSRSID